MKNWKKILLVLVVVGLMSASGVYYYVFVYSKDPSHRRNVANEKGIVITATDLVKGYQANEKNSDSLYLNKTIQVSGEIIDIKDDMDGKSNISLKTADSTAMVTCALKQKDASLKLNQSVTIKGICTGFIGDVVLNESVVIK